MSTESTGRPPVGSRLRASDAEREKFAELVREAVGEGRLDMAEGDQRLNSIYGAKFRDELPPFVVDLPGAGRPADDRPGPVEAGGPFAGRGSQQAWSGGWGRGPSGPGGTGGSDAGPLGPWSQARWASRRRRGLGLHTGGVAIIAAVLIGLWALSAAHFFWPIIPLAFLTIGLLRHWRWRAWHHHHHHHSTRS